MQVAIKKDVIRRKMSMPAMAASNPSIGLPIIETLAENDEVYRLSDLAIRAGRRPFRDRLAPTRRLTVGLVYRALRQDGDASEQCDQVRLPSRLCLDEQGGQL
jgi:hypothetical protein